MAPRPSPGDDVGSGYSSLSLIRTLSSDGLRIDGSYIRAVQGYLLSGALAATTLTSWRRGSPMGRAAEPDLPDPLTRAATHGSTDGWGRVVP